MHVAFIYTISAKSKSDQWPHPFYKIGFSINPHWRLSELGIKNARVSLDRIAPCQHSDRHRLERLAHSYCQQFSADPNLIYSLFRTQQGTSEWFYFEDKRDALGFHYWWKCEFAKIARESFGNFIYESLKDSLEELLKG